MLWLKTFHILFVMSWMAGIFYLPRIFVHFVEGQKEGHEVIRLAIMGRKLYKFMTLMMMLAIGSGIWLWLAYFPVAQGMGWLHAKIVLVVLMLVYHMWSKGRVKEMEEGRLTHNGKYYRWMNELPLFLTFGILFLVVFKPF
ncbi:MULTISPECIES: CopD family protein [Thiomicrorhabdus]|uniref:Protoporphyrinogen IX oxidase n=1 Tax=Thiomicrorhabdus heinhorstiae TaxID=2748010 RepID=A0ABS0BSB6_9GAMM|nr:MULTISPECIES: CopD family protein [Thiomicrorhabdus]MBF6056773.1 CopD family protein [Thiomicrorhabdus heinhorstiae]